MKNINTQLIAEMKEEEKLAIDKLRTRVKNEIEKEMYDDIFLFHRFLAARDFNIDHAENMLRKHIEFRKKYDVKNIFNFRRPEVVVKYVVYELIGFDKDGCPIRYSPVGDLDIMGLLTSVKFEDMAKTIIYEMESDTRILREQSEKLKTNIHRVIYIANLKNLSFAQCVHKRSVHLLLFLLNAFVNNCPERLKVGYIINAPVYYSIVYSLLRSVLPSKVMDKIFVYSDDSFKKDILKYVDADELPAFLGGNQTDPDGNPLCLTKFKQAAGPIPEKYFIHKSKRNLSKLPDVQKVTLSRASFHEVNLDVKEPGSYLEWEFETKCRDIGFGIFFNEILDGKEKVTELVAIERIDTEEYSETGTLKCDHSGTYVIVFDNTYSWIRAKEIYYRVKIVSPKEHDAEIRRNDKPNETLRNV